MKKVLVTDGVHELLLEGLENLGYQVDYFPKITLSKVSKIADQYQGMIINSKILMHKDLMEKSSQLQFVGRLGSGMEIIDLELAKKKGIAVFNAPEGNRNAVGEHALGMLLSLANNLARADRELRNFTWNREANRGFELSGKTIGIIGFGHTGTAFGQKLLGLGMRVLAFDKYKTDYPFPVDFIEKSDLQTIQIEADIISFHLPLTPETHHFANSSFIQKCKKGVILINTSRGNVIEMKTLIEGLQNGSIGGACLDVFENEKPSTFTDVEKKDYSNLYQFQNVILSPHVAGWTFESKRKLSEILLNKIKSYLSQKKDKRV